MTTPVVTEDGLVIIVSSGNDHAMFAVDPNDIADPEKPTPGIAWKFTDAKGHWIAAPLVVGDRSVCPEL